MKLEQTPAWSLLQQYHSRVRLKSIRAFFATDPARAERMQLEAAGLHLDYAKHRIDAKGLALLARLAAECELPRWREAMFRGDPINNTEGRAVLHTALRAASPPSEVRECLQRMYAFAEALREGEIRGGTGKRITDVVNIGIGGSDLGPRMVVRALRTAAADTPRVHFVANVDPADLSATLESLTPASTLFIVASKTFTTVETLTNAQRARAWVAAALGPAAAGAHFAAVSSNVRAAGEFGIEAERVFPMWDWVGGRYSLWSAVGLSIAVAIGEKGFTQLLGGARAMDDHFHNSPLEANMPVLLGLLGLWYCDFHGAQSHAVLPYSNDLDLFPAFLQQLEMESNGKRVDRAGEPVSYATGPVVWGSVGTNGQHAFHQLLHQGTLTIPSDFIIVARCAKESEREAHRLLIANALAQSAALMSGKENPREPHREYPGNQPSSTIVMPQLDAHHLGALIALYEHKVFVQGVLWGINSFDQWGVELGKQLAQSLAPALADGAPPADTDASTRNLIALLKKLEAS